MFSESLEDRPDVGLTLVLTSKWMMAAILTAPYTSNSNGCPVYLDGFSFSGLVSLQTVEKKWPATAGLECHEPTILEAMATSTYYATVEPPVVGEDEAEKGEDSEGNPNDMQSSKDGQSQKA